MSIKKDLLYAATHEWVRIEGAEAVIGITHFAQEQLGDITFVELPQVGDSLEAGKEMGSVESVKAASDLYSPVSGEVLAVNTALEDAPEKVNASPYEEGWLVRLRLKGAPSGLLDAEAYAGAVASEENH
ncbi:MAG: glycine cleavage system protein GcvH [Desulfovibrio sp.]|jgi:glycine cleavage system H protein|nr:glycine cleavage system protein GcvH [Desulfovibrio sp.]